MLYWCFSPTPNISWQYEEEGRSLPIGRYEHPTEMTLRIWDIEYEDQGNIVCTGTNEMGTNTTTLTFVVQGECFT